MFPGQLRIIVPPACPGFFSWYPPIGIPTEHFNRGASRRHPDQMPKPPQRGSLNVEEQQLFSEPLKGDLASDPISNGEPSHPAEETNFSHFYL